MASRSRHHWKKKESLLGFYSLIFLHLIIPTTAAPFHSNTARNSIIEQSLQAIQATAELHAQTSSDENSEKRQNNKASDNASDTIQKLGGDQSEKTHNSLLSSITKRSIDVSNFPLDFSNLYQNEKQDSSQTKNCNGGLCSGKFQIWDNQDYNTNFPDDEDYADSINRNMIPYETKLPNKGTVQYYSHGQDDIFDAYSLSHRTIPRHEYSPHQPKIVIVALPKTSSAEQDQQVNSRDESQILHEVKKNIFTSRGWGAGGMPFSVLYLHQQQHLKPAARSPIAGAQQLIAPPAPLRGFPSQYRQVAVRNALSSALTSANNGGGGGSAAGTPLPTRRQYSIIPQLYVSYGWGPHGK